MDITHTYSVNVVSKKVKQHFITKLNRKVENVKRIQTQSIALLHRLLIDM